MKISFTSAVLVPLLSLALLSSCDRSVSTVSSENGSVAIVPRFAAASVPAVSRLEARLSATGQSDSVVNVPYQKGGDLELGSVPSGAAFTVSMTGYDSISSQRLVRWTGSGSSTADEGSSAKYVDISTTSGPAAPSLVVGDTVVPQTLPLAGMWYTTDGTDPRLVSKAKKATGNVVIDSACTVRAAHDTVIAGDTLWSDTVSWTFTAASSPVTTVAAPAFSVAEGSYASAQKVGLSSATSGASIYYTTNGATPTSSSTLYTDSLTVSASETIQAVAVLNGASSEVTSVTYTITPVTPTKSPYKLTVSSETGGRVTLSPTGPTFASGTVVTATATANSGYTFTGWTGACTGTSSSCKVTMTQDTTLGANFAAVPSTDTTLATLAVSTGTLTPVFSPKTTAYFDTVGATATSETITATANASNATVSGAGNFDLSTLAQGKSITKTITVTNGASSLAYTVTIVKRAVAKTDTSLASLKVSTGTLTPVFSPKTTAYFDTVGATATSETITATANASNATVSGAGNFDLSTLAQGKSITKTITVTSGTYSLSYTVTIVKRLARYRLAASVTNGTLVLKPASSTGTDTGYYDSGTTVIATVTPSSGNVFVKWTEGSSSKLAICTLVVSKSTELAAQCSLGVLDTRDNQVYYAVKIGTQTWMKTNLNYKLSNHSGYDTGSCYNNTFSNCGGYGRLYTQALAMAGLSSSRTNPSNVQGICPAGWHIPSSAEWKVLLTYVDTDSAAYFLKDAFTWSTDGAKGNDKYGFGAIAAGFQFTADGTFANAGKQAIFLSSEYDATKSTILDFSGVSAACSNTEVAAKNRFSLRCLRDN